MSDEEDLFGDGEETETKVPPPAPTGDDDDGLFGDDDDDVQVSKPRSHRFDKDDDDDDDDNDNNMEVSRGSTAQADGDDGADDEFGELFGESLPTPSSKKANSTSSLRITKTHEIPDDAKTVLVRMPNVLKMQDQEFFADKYSKEEDMETIGRMAMGIRWRHKTDPDGNKILDSSGAPQIESNARLVKFKNGSMQIFVGSESYDFAPQPVENCFVFMQKVSRIRGERRTALERVGQVQARSSIQPTSITAASRKFITKTVKEENRKVKKIQTVLRQDQVLQQRPEQRMHDLEKDEAKKIQLLRKQRGDRDEGRYQHQTGRIRMSADYLNENDDQYDTVNISDLKQGRKSQRKRRGDDDVDTDEDSSDEDDEDDDLDGFIVKGKGDDDDDDDEGPRFFRKDGKKPPKKAKPAKKSRDEEEEEEDEDEEEDEEEEEEDDDDDDDDDDEGETEAPKRKKAAVASSQDQGQELEAEAEAGHSSKRRKQVIDDDDDE